MVSACGRPVKQRDGSVKDLDSGERICVCLRYASQCDRPSGRLCKPDRTRGRFICVISTKRSLTMRYVSGRAVVSSRFETDGQQQRQRRPWKSVPKSPPFKVRMEFEEKCFFILFGVCLHSPSFLRPSIMINGDSHTIQVMV